MRILFYFGGFAPVGGIETFCKNLLCYLQPRKYDVSLVCWGKKSPLIEKIADAGIKVLRSPWKWGSVWKLPDWVLLPFGINEVKKAEIIIFGKYLPLSVLNQIKKQARPNTRFVFVTPYRPIPPKDQAKRNLFLQEHSVFDLIIVQASEFERDLRKLGYKGEVATIPYITQEEGAVLPYPQSEEFKIGFLGRFVEDKNLPLLLRAFKVFKEKHLGDGLNKPTPTLHMFGDGVLKNDLIDLCSELEISSSVFFYGAVANSEIKKHVSSCHLFAFSSNIEGQCLAALEILSYGRPIVATEAGAFPDILSDERLGKLVKNATPENFAHALFEMFSMVEKNEISPGLVYNAYMEKYSPMKIGVAYENLFNKINESLNRKTIVA